jgi:hypothetical protein
MKTLTIIISLIISTLAPPFIGGVEVSADVVMKILVVNPSDTEAQTVPLNVHLPKEVSPKDIIEMGDLTLSYDADTGMYSVRAEVPLGPGESVNKFVRIRDIWERSEEELSALEKEAKEAAKKLEGTEFEEQGLALVHQVREKIEGIIRKQEETANNPEERIRAYRQGAETLDSIKENLTDLTDLKLEASMGNPQGMGPLAKKEGKDDGAGKDEGKGKGDKGKELTSAGSRIPIGDDPDGAPLGRSISMTTAWRIIFGIIIFLAIVSGVFYMFWHRLLGINVEQEVHGEPLSTEVEQADGSAKPMEGSQPQ